MSPEELKNILAEIGSSQRQAARILRINERTIRRYIAGDLAVPTTVKLALYWILDGSRKYRIREGIQEKSKSGEVARQATRAKQVD